MIPPVAYAQQQDTQQQSEQASLMEHGGKLPMQDDPYVGQYYQSGFHMAQIRKAFIAKVFTIVLLQLVFTTGVACIFRYVDAVNDYVLDNIWVFNAAWVLTLVLLIVGACSAKALRRYPFNYMFLFTFTALFAVMVASITVLANTKVIISALILTIGIVGVMGLVAQCGCDMTERASLLSGLSCVAIIAIIVGIFWVDRIYYILVSAFFAALFSAYLVYDIQLIMGDRARAIGPDDWVFAAMAIYLDIINIFLSLLQILALAGAGN